MLQFGICNVSDIIRYGWATRSIYHLRRPPLQLSVGVGNIFRSLQSNGTFITGSNGDPGSKVNSTIYHKEHDRFVRLYNSADGSHIDDLITNLRFSKIS